MKCDRLKCRFRCTWQFFTTLKGINITTYTATWDRKHKMFHLAWRKRHTWHTFHAEISVTCLRNIAFMHQYKSRLCTPTGHDNITQSTWTWIGCADCLVCSTGIHMHGKGWHLKVHSVSILSSLEDRDECCSMCLCGSYVFLQAKVSDQFCMCE